MNEHYRLSITDVADSIALIKREGLDLEVLAERYKETAGYYYNRGICKTNLG